MSDMTTLEKTVCIQLDVSLWCGTRRLQDEDLGSASENLPPRSIASRGSLKLCDPKILAPLSNIKRATERDCEDLCAGFLRGYATDIDNLDALAHQLKDRDAEFVTEVQNLTKRLPDSMVEWAQRHPKWKDVIEREIPYAPRFVARYDFKYQFFRVGAASDGRAGDLNGGLVEAAQGLSGQLFKEIEVEATTAFKRSFLQRDAVGQKALRPVRKILRKLEALQYLDARCGVLIDRISLVLAGLPKSGPIGEPHLSAIVGLLAILGSAEAAVRAQTSVGMPLNGTHADGGLFEKEDSEDDEDLEAVQDTSTAIDNVEELPITDRPRETPVLPPRSGVVPTAVEPPAALWI